ncbi:Em GEA1 (EM1) [Methanocella sp. CWC-04]|uniref:Em GEA1 (EM1) n=2 Tax=Methanooceanicella nereidis TaxID=2052831 RepID=A0AAP2W4W6_9EURY|nr:Em GEA1 (EM1) [Methanocella sp. CWC-04]
METEKKGSMSVKDAGRKGGLSTSKSHDRKFYEMIGHKGGLKGGQRVRELIEKGKETEIRKS